MRKQSRSSLSNKERERDRALFASEDTQEDPYRKPLIKKIISKHFSTINTFRHNFISEQTLLVYPQHESTPSLDRGIIYLVGCDHGLSTEEDPPKLW